MKATNSRDWTETLFHFGLKGVGRRNTPAFAKNKPNNVLANSTNDALATKRALASPRGPVDEQRETRQVIISQRTKTRQGNLWYFPHVRSYTLENRNEN